MCRPAAGPNARTARWMAPEQLTLGIMNLATDMYSFAMTMYEVRA